MEQVICGHCGQDVSECACVPDEPGKGRESGAALPLTIGKVVHLGVAVDEPEA